MSYKYGHFTELQYMIHIYDTEYDSQLYRLKDILQKYPDTVYLNTKNTKILISNILYLI